MFIEYLSVPGMGLGHQCGARLPVSDLISLVRQANNYSCDKCCEGKAGSVPEKNSKAFTLVGWRGKAEGWLIWAKGGTLVSQVEVG